MNSVVAQINGHVVKLCQNVAVVQIKMYAALCLCEFDQIPDLPRVCHALVHRVTSSL